MPKEFHSNLKIERLELVNQQLIKKVEALEEQVESLGQECSQYRQLLRAEQDKIKGLYQTLRGVLSTISKSDNINQIRLKVDKIRQILK